MSSSTTCKLRTSVAQSEATTYLFLTQRIIPPFRGQQLIPLRSIFKDVALYCILLSFFIINREERSWLNLPFLPHTQNTSIPEEKRTIPDEQGSWFRRVLFRKIRLSFDQSRLHPAPNTHTASWLALAFFLYSYISAHLALVISGI